MAEMRERIFDFWYFFAWRFRQPYGENAKFARARPVIFHFYVHLFTEWAYLLVHE